jgi:hypothetical protein
MKLLKFNTFLNESESHTKDEDTFKYIFMDLIDNGFDFEFETVFFTETFLRNDGGYSNNADQTHKKPGYVVKLVKRLPEDRISVDFNESKKIMDILEECNSRISEYGEHALTQLDFGSDYHVIEYLLLDKESKEEEVNTTAGFDTFVYKIETKWSRANNKLTRSFKLQRTKEGITLSPTDNSIGTKSLLSTVKQFVYEATRRRTYMGGGPNWAYKYDTKLDDNKIHIIFKERIDETDNRYY